MGEVGRAVKFLSGRRDEMEALLRDLVELNSHTDNAKGVRVVAVRLAEALASLGEITVSLVERGSLGPHLVARTAAPGARVLLVGHLDTVFRPGTFLGYRSDGALAFGPGVLDMKGGLVVAVFALRALAAAGALRNVPLAFVAVADEEIGSPEGQLVIGDVALEQGAVAGLVVESGRAGDLVVTRRKGTGAATVTARGRAAHAGNEHADGRNAIWTLARFVDAAQRVTDYARGVTVNVGRVEGGQGKNTVPDLATALVDFRFERADDGDATLEALRRAAREAAAAVPGTTIDVDGRIARQPLERTAGSAALFAVYSEAARAAGLGVGEAPLQGGGSDANTLGAAGIPAIDALGPRGTGYHTTEERIELASLVPKAEALTRAMIVLSTTGF